MEVTTEMIDKLAHLARLEFNDRDKIQIRSDLERMISFVEKLDELDLDGVEPMMHMTTEVNVLRDDVVAGSVDRKVALSNAPETDGTFFLVPKVIRK